MKAFHALFNVTSPGLSRPEVAAHRGFCLKPCGFGSCLTRGLRGNQSRTCCPEELEDLLLDNLAEDVGKIPPTRDSGGRIEAPLHRCAWD